VFFIGSGSDSDGAIVAYLWDSSIDGEIGTEEDFSSSGLSLGHHAITFLVQDNDGAWSDPQASGENGSVPGIQLWIYAVPVAIAGQDSTGTPGVPLQFSGAGTDEDGTIAKYEWDFDGDGVFEWSSTENGLNTYIYNNEDTYTATLRVTDNDGFTNTDTVDVTISEKKIQIDDEGNVTVTPAEEGEEGIPAPSLAAAVAAVAVIALRRRR
jgi:PKD repeat protein